MDDTELKLDSMINFLGVCLLASQAAMAPPSERPKMMILTGHPY
ncbi:MAG: hypothetical protein OEY89_02385 [Gammaproteobacteria bacterium]|nr:hypothetical protein [Gammaproteobacteria bacterium]